MREKAIAEYHELLAGDESLKPELFARLRAGMAAARLLHGERPLGVSLRPHLLTRAQYDRMARASESLASAFDKVIDALVAEPALLERVGLLDMERRLALVNPGYTHPAATSRLDVFVNGEEVRCVEYNAENPSSLTDQTGLNQLLFEVGALQRLSERYRLRQFAPVNQLLQTLLDTYYEWGGRDVPQIAILDWADLPTGHEFILLRNYFVGCGVPTVICTPEELEYTRGRLRRRDFRIDLVYKRVIIHELLSRFDEASALVRAYTDGNVCMVNSFRCKIAHKKAAFELLTDEANAGWFTPQEREAIARCVPWTRRLAERKTLYRGREVDLLEFVRRNRRGLILKPNDDYGGHGVLLGHRASEAEWDALLGVALEADYIVQELIELHMEEFPVFNESEWSFEPMYVDCNPFLFRGRVEGAMVRLSDSPVVNVSSGGGETGFFVIEGEVGS
ncbi:MAG TPA: hypothetical protein VGB73_12080 [Pyrinomonadaceae bacterium]|jgi:hypothetical protein